MPNTVDLQFSVTKQDITRVDDNIVASGAIHTIVANFDFCATWDGIHKYARFEGAGGILDVRIEDDKCVVPWEVIEAPSFTVAVFGTKTTDVMITTRKLAVKVYQSANFIEPEPVPPTPSLIERYEQEIQKLVDSGTLNDAISNALPLTPVFLTDGQYEPTTGKPTVNASDYETDTKKALYFTPVYPDTNIPDMRKWLWVNGDYVMIGMTGVMHTLEHLEIATISNETIDTIWEGSES